MNKKTTHPEPIARRLPRPGFPLPKGNRGVLAWRWAEQRLRKSRNFCIATVRQDGRPHLMVVWGLWFDGILYFSTGPATQKARNLERNPHCVICTDQHGEAVIIEAMARKLSVSELHKDLLELYRRKFSWDPLSLGNAIYAAHPSVVFGMDEKRGPRYSTRWAFP